MALAAAAAIDQGRRKGPTGGVGGFQRKSGNRLEVLDKANARGSLKRREKGSREGRMNKERTGGGEKKKELVATSFQGHNTFSHQC